MHPAKLIKELKFVEYHTGAVITHEIIKEMKDVPAAQYLVSSINMELIKLKYSFTTNKHKYREAYKYMFINEGDLLSDEYRLQIELLLENWVEDFNKQWPRYSMSEVELLDIEFMGHANLELQ